jgi:hypothetical protein
MTEQVAGTLSRTVAGYFFRSLVIAGNLGSFLGVTKNRGAILDIEVPGRQDAKTQEYLDSPRFRTAAQRDCISVQTAPLLLRKPLGGRIPLCRKKY